MTLTIAAASAQAVDIPFVGSGFYQQIPPPFSPNPIPPPTYFDWFGHVITSNDETADGVHYTAEWVAQANVGPWGGGTATYTIADGLVTSFNSIIGLSGVTIDGLSIRQRYFDPKAISLFADGTLLPIPEPETWALLLGGLVALGARARKRCT